MEGVDTLDAAFVASFLHPKEKVLEEYILIATIDTQQLNLSKSVSHFFRIHLELTYHFYSPSVS